MKKLLAVLALGVFGTAFACMDNAWYPVVEGATWTYSMDGELFTQTITSVTADGFTMEAVIGDFTSTMEFVCDDDGVVQLGGLPGMEDLGVAMEMEILEQEGVQFPARFAPGEAWSYSMSMAMKMSMDMEGVGAMAMDTTSVVNTDSRFGDYESVTVSAGTFTALPMHSDSQVSVTMSMMGMNMPASEINTSSIAWYAEGVGMISSETDGTRDMELVSYSIP